MTDLRLKGSKLVGTYDAAGAWWPEWWGKYVGTPFFPGASFAVLAATHCRRLASLSYAAQRRARLKGMRAEFVDLIAVGIKQEWKCFICGLPMDHITAKSSPQRVSVEHDPPLSRARFHDHTNTHLAHWICNNRKGNSHT